MHSLLVMGLAAGSFGATLCGGLLALRLRDRLHLLLGFSAGAVLAVVFFDLLPEALKLSRQEPFDVLAMTALGFFAYTILDRVTLLHAHHAHHAGSEAAVVRGWAGAASLSAHSLMDGFAIGIGFQASVGAGIMIAAAVLAHDCSDGMNTVGLVLKNSGTRRQAFAWLLTDAIAPVAGAAISLVVQLPQETLALILALFGGFFLYIGASDLLPESFHGHPKALTTASTLLGAAGLYIVARLTG